MKHIVALTFSVEVQHYRKGWRRVAVKERETRKKKQRRRKKEEGRKGE